jgi:hypothetical protein
MLVPPNPNVALQQGDIIRDVPFVLFPKVFNVKVEGVQGQKRLDSQDLATFDQVKEFSQGKQLTAAAVPFLLTPALVVTQGCDLDFKDQITLARIYPIGHLLQDAKDALGHDEPVVLHEVIRSITEGYESLNLVYLGPLEGVGRCAADLMRVQSFPEVWKECFRQKRWMSLTDEGVKYVQGRLNAFTGRYALRQGFWHMGEDGDIARRLEQEPGALDRALAQLEAKKTAPKK